MLQFHGIEHDLTTELQVFRDEISCFLRICKELEKKNTFELRAFDYLPSPPTFEKLKANLLENTLIEEADEFNIIIKPCRDVMGEIGQTLEPASPELTAFCLKVYPDGPSSFPLLGSCGKKSPLKVALEKAPSSSKQREFLSKFKEKYPVLFQNEFSTIEEALVRQAELETQPERGEEEPTKDFKRRKLLFKVYNQIKEQFAEVQERDRIIQELLNIYTTESLCRVHSGQGQATVMSLASCLKADSRSNTMAIYQSLLQQAKDAFHSVAVGVAMDGQFLDQHENEANDLFLKELVADHPHTEIESTAFKAQRTGGGESSDECTLAKTFVCPE